VVVHAEDLDEDGVIHLLRQRAHDLRDGGPLVLVVVVVLVAGGDDRLDVLPLTLPRGHLEELAVEEEGGVVVAIGVDRGAHRERAPPHRDRRSEVDVVVVVLVPPGEVGDGADAERWR
jgi:hypothetical protein